MSGDLLDPRPDPLLGITYAQQLAARMKLSAHGLSGEQITRLVRAGLALDTASEVRLVDVLDAAGDAIEALVRIGMDREAAVALLIDRLECVANRQAAVFDAVDAVDAGADGYACGQDIAHFSPHG